MTNLNSSIFYALVMLIAGLGIPIMAALNGGLGSKIQSPILASTLIFFVGGFISLLYLYFSNSLPTSMPSASIPFYYYFGGIIVAFYIFSITWVAPKFGVGNAIAFVLLGQLISMSAVDHFSFLDAPQYSFSLHRCAGLLLMAAGVFLTVRRF